MKPTLLRHRLMFVLVRVLAVLAALVGIVGLVHWTPQTFRSLEEQSGDFIWRWGAHTQLEQRFVIVDIDEESLQRIGAWPWSREQMAVLQRRLVALGSTLQLYDVVFPAEHAQDAVFVDALRSGAAVLAQAFALEHGTAAQTGHLSGALNAPDCQQIATHAQGYIANAASFSSMWTGHIAPHIDRDGQVRRIPPVVCFAQRPYAALSIAGVLRGSGVPWSMAVRRSADGEWLAPYAWVESDDDAVHVRNPAWRIPVDAYGNMRISYALKPDSFISVSAADVLENRVPQELFRGTWTLIGSTALGIGDAVPTPHGGAEGGVGVHAQMLSALLDERVPYTPQGAEKIQFILAMLGILGLMLLAGRGRVSVVVLPLMGLGLAVVWYGLHAWLLLSRSIWLGWVAPASLMLLAALFLAIIEHAWTRFERERLFANLSSYLPAAVAGALALRRVSDKIEAERRQVTVLFADIRNFSAYCEAQPAEQTARVLHDFFALSTQIIEAHGGVIEAMQGDAVLAVWHTPQACANDVTQALDAALALVNEAEKLLQPFDHEDLAPLAVGVGIESGVALVGSFGSAQRRLHAVLGMPVAVAVRLQAMTHELAQAVLVGDKAAALLPEQRVRSQGAFLLEGLRQPQKIFAPWTPPVD